MAMIISGYNVKRDIKENSVFKWVEADNLNNDQVVVQVPQQTVSENKKQISELKEYFEAVQAIAGIDHLHPKQVLSDTDYGLIIEYPYKPHEPLREALAREPENAGNWWRQACDALFRLHKNELEHGGVSLDSFVVVKGRAHLTNFGYAPLIKNGHADAMVEVSSGAAPETRLRNEVTPASDQYALAKALAEWRHEFEQSDVYDMATKDDPKDRYERIREMQTALKTYLQPTMYDVSVKAQPKNAGTTCGGGKWQAGKKVQVEARPNEGWRFDHWSGDLSGHKNPALVTVDGKKIIAAHFAKVPVTLWVKIEPPEAGEAWIDDTSIDGEVEFDRGREVTVEVSPRSKEWKFTKWERQATGSDSSIKITMDSNKVVVARFERTGLETGGPQEPPAGLTPIYELSIRAEPQAGGRIKGDGQYQFGADGKPSEATIKATPNKGYRFDHWDGDISSDAKNPATLTMDSNKKIVAHFTRQKVSVMVIASIDPPKAGSVDGCGQYDKGVTVTLRAVPSSTSIKFGEWAGDVRGATNPIRVRANRDIRVTAQFRNVDYVAAVRKKVFIMTLGSPVTICPFIAFMTSLMVIWAFGISFASGLVPFVCIGGLIVNCGIFLTRLILGSERLTTCAKEEIAEEKAA